MSSSTAPTPQPQTPTQRQQSLTSLIRSLRPSSFPSSHSPPRRPLSLPGGLSTHLTQLLGPNALHQTLWSASLLRTHPEAIQTAHEHYFDAGAELATTNTYQAAPRGLVEAWGISESEAEGLVKRGVEIARAAAASDTNQPTKPRYIVGSIGPYGAYLADGSEYTGAYSAHTFHAEFKSFHRPRVRALAAAGVDGFACETMPCLSEIAALLDVLREEAPGAPVWVSVSLDASGSKMAEGTELTELCALLRGYGDVVAVGVNCVPREVVTGAVRRMRVCMEGWGQEERKTLVVYPNSGEEWDAVAKEWRVGRATARNVEDWMEEWVGEGVGMLGGCCRVEPEETGRMRAWVDGKFGTG